MYKIKNGVDANEIYTQLISGVPVVFTGNDTISLYQIYSPDLVIKNSTTYYSNQVANGLWLQTEENETIEHQIQIYDYSITNEDLETVSVWLKESSSVTTPTGYRILGIITQIENHEPYGTLETRIEVLKLIEENEEDNWLDITVTQRLTPGANFTISNWVWNWLQYTMNGSLGVSNIYLSDYDSPNIEELPKGPFSFLWRLLGFDLRKFIPWLYPSKPQILGIDMSDFSLELFKIRYEASRGYDKKNMPLTKRHHYVIRTREGISPIFWHQTQVQYTKADDYAQIPYLTHPLASGYIMYNR